MKYLPKIAGVLCLLAIGVVAVGDTVEPDGPGPNPRPNETYLYSNYGTMDDHEMAKQPTLVIYTWSDDEQDWVVYASQLYSWDSSTNIAVGYDYYTGYPIYDQHHMYEAFIGSPYIVDTKEYMGERWEYLPDGAGGNEWVLVGGPWTMTVYTAEGE